MYCYDKRNCCTNDIDVARGDTSSWNNSVHGLQVFRGSTVRYGRM